MSKTYSFNRLGASLVGGLFNRTTRGLWLGATGIMMLMLMSTDSLAQLTYYSKPAATDFSATSSWGINADGSGAAPSSISNADNFIVANSSVLTLTGDASVRTLTITSGSLTVSANTLTVSLSTGNNSTFQVSGGTFNLSAAGNVVVNGNYTHTGGTVNMTGGAMTIDPNNNNDGATSVPSGTHAFNLTVTTANYSGGTITIVDPPVSTYAASSTRSINLATSSSVTSFSANHTFVMGDGVSTTPGNVDGFAVETYTSSQTCIRNLVVNGGSGTGRWTTNAYGGSTSWGLWVSGNVTVNANSEFRTNTTANCVFGGNVANNGIITCQHSPGIVFGRSITSFPAFDALIINAATISGSGIFRSASTSPTGLFLNVTFNNPVGITFANPSQLALGGSVVTSVVTTLNLNQGAVNLGGGSFTLGTGTGATGTWTYAAGGFNNGTFTRWVGTTTLPASITGVQGTFPFLVNGLNRNLQIAASTAPTAGGQISVSHTNAAGLNTITAIEGMDRSSNSSWTVTTTGVTGGTYLMRLSGDGVAVLTGTVGNSPRILQGSGVVGTHSAATGTVAAHFANRTAIASANFLGTNTYSLGYAQSDLGVYSVQTGNWEDGTTWSGGVAPTAGQDVTILGGHTITVNATPGVCRGLALLGNSVLNVSGSSLTTANGITTEAAYVTSTALSTITVSGGTFNIGASTNTDYEAGALISGTFTVNGTGAVNVFGYLNFASSAFFTQSGSSTITIDGNRGGVAANSVALATSLLQFTAGGNACNLFGGTITIVDPHFLNTGNALNYNVTTTNTAASTAFVFGNGVSTDAGGTNGFTITQPGSGRLSFASLTVNAPTGTNRYVRIASNNMLVSNALTITTGELRIEAGNTLHVAGTLTNNGTLSTLGALAFQSWNGGSGGSAVAVAATQTLSGIGTFRNLTAAPTASFATLIFNNTSVGGIIFNGTAWAGTSTVSGALNWTAGRVTIPAASTFTLGTGTLATGTLTYTAGGFTAGTFQRWYASGIITLGVNATLFPFVSAAGDVRNASFGSSVAATGGTVLIRYNDGVGTNSVTGFNDASAIISRVSNANWVVSTANSFAIGTAGGQLRFRGDGIATIASFGTVRATGATAAGPGTSAPGTGSTANPEANKIALANTAAFANTWYFGAPNTITSAASGNFEDGASWSGGVAPTSGDNVVILSTHVITVNATASACNAVGINAGGSLIISGSSLTVGGATFNSAVNVNGTLTLNGGDLTIRGNLAILNGASFTQSTGTITIDGNDNGATATSVASGTPLFAIGTAATSFSTGTLSVTGGNLIIVDPHAATTATHAIYYRTSSAYNLAFAGGHTTTFGDGTSTQAGGVANGFWVNGYVGTLGRLSFGNVTVNSAAGTNRSVTFDTSSPFILNNLNVNLGTINTAVDITVAGNVNVATGGSIINSAGWVFALPSGAFSIVNPTAQSVTVTGTGTIVNNATTVTANFVNVTINNSSSTGVTFGALNTITGAAASPASCAVASGTVTFTSGLMTTSGTNGFIMGAFGAAIAGPGTLTVTSGGVAPGSTFGRAWTAAQTGSAVAASADPTTTTSRYPFVSATGANRSVWQLRVTPSAAGVYVARYTDATSISTVSVADGAYTINRRFDGNWRFSNAGTAIAEASNTMSFSAPGSFGVLPPANPQVRVMTAGGVLGTHQAGTVTPNAQRTGLTSAQLVGNDLYMGINNTDLIVFSVATGDWNSGSTWNTGSVPVTTDAVQVLSPHVVSVTSGVGTIASVSVAAGGSLNLTSGGSLTITNNLTNAGTTGINGGTLTVNGSAASSGVTNTGTVNVASGTLNIGSGANFNRTFSNTAAGSVLTVSGGNMNVQGNIAFLSGTWNQSGGTISVDPNNAGTATNSVAGGTSTVQISTNLLNLTGGTVVIVDPNFTGANAVIYSSLSNYDTPASSTHTWQFGNGVSNDISNSTTAFNLNTWPSSGRISFGNIVVDALNGNNRFVPTTYSYGINGNLTINSGDLRGSSAIYVTGNLVNNGTLTMTSTLAFQRFLGGTTSTTNQAQSISGTGVFRNATSAPTGNLVGLTLQNNATAGLTINVPLVMTGTLTITSGVINTDATNILTLGSVSAGTTGGGATAAIANGWINGPMRRVFQQGIVSNTIINSSTAFFPVGTASGGAHMRILPLTNAGTTNAASSVVIQAQAFNDNVGQVGNSIIGLVGGRRWEWSVVSGAANISADPLGVGFGVADPAAASGMGVAFAPTADGIYDLPNNIGSTFDTPSAMLYTNATIPLTPTNFTTQFIRIAQTGPLAVGTVAAFNFTGFTSANATNANVFGFVVPVIGSSGGQTMNTVTLNYTGTSAADIASSGVSLWAGNAAGPQTQIGTAQSISSGSVTFSALSRALVAGNNWFYVRVNTVASPTILNLVDFSISAGGITITETSPSVNAGTQPASTLDPTGSLTVYYCWPTWSTGCSSNDFLTEFVLGDINRTGITCTPSVPLASYRPSETTSFEQGATYTASFVAASGGTQNVGIWIDFDNNGVFDASEFLGNSSAPANGASTLNITIPGTAALGTRVMRVICRFNTANTAADACLSAQYGTTNDYVVTIAGPTPRAVTAVNTQARSGYLQQNATNNNVHRLEVIGTGSLGSLNLTGVTVNFTGTNAADIAASGVTLWAGSATAPTTQIGTAQSFVSGSATFSGLTRSIGLGSTYFWVRLNTATGAVRDNLIDVEIPTGGLTFAATGGASGSGTWPATALNGAGTYRVWYCAGGNVIGGSVDCTSPQRMDPVTMTGVTTNLNATGVCDVDNGGLFSINGTSAAPVVDIRSGSSFTLNVTPNTAGGSIGAWIDFNNNMSFEASEFVGAVTTTVAGPNAITVAVPWPASYTGTTLMRVRSRANNTMTSGLACTSMANSQTIDFWVNILPAPDCSTATPGTYPSTTTASTTLTSPLCVAGPAPVNATFDTPVSPYTNIQYQWQYSATAGGTYSNVGTALTTGAATSLALNAVSGSFAGFYRLLVQCNANGTGPVVDLSTTHNPVEIQIENPTVTNTTSVSNRCGLGTINVTASTTGTGVNWYTVPTGGTPFATTAGATSSANATLTALGNTTLYAEPIGIPQSTTSNGGVLTPTSTTGSTSQDWGLVFTATQTLVFNSVTVYPIGTGTVDVAIRANSPSGTELGSSGAVSVTGTGSTTPVVITFPTPITVPAGTNYRLILKSFSGVNLIRESSGVTFPYNSPGLSFTASEWGGTTTGFYYYFYNVNYTTIATCLGTRVPVVVTADAPPAVTLSAPSPACSGNVLTLTAADPTAHGYTFAWPDAGVTSASATTATVTPSIAFNGGPRVIRYNVNASSPTCATAAFFDVTVNPSPQIVTATMNPVSGQACVDGSVSFNATANPIPIVVFNENFATSIPGTWNATNQNTGTTGLALRVWNYQANNYQYNTNANSRMVTNDGSGMAYVNSDASGTSLEITKSVFTSPAFSTTGVSAMVIRLEHNYRSVTGDTTLVQMSTNGTTWTTVQTFTASLPSATSGAMQTTNITVPVAFENQPSVRMRFYYRSAYGWWWAIDQVTVSANPAVAPVYTWSGPNGFSSSGLTATHSNLVLADSGPHVFTATQNGCTSTSAALNVTVNAPPVVNITSTPPSVASMCPGDAVVLNANESAGSGTIIDINWQRNGTTVSGALTGVLDLTSHPFGYGNYTVNVTNSNSCITSANFNIAPVTYNVTVNASGPGSVTSVPTGNVHNCGSSPVYTFTPTDGCQEIVSLSLNGSPVTLPTPGTSRSVTLTDIRADQTLDVVFAQRQFGVAFSNPTSNGASFSVSPAIVNGSTTIGCGDSRTYTFIPADPCDEITAVEINGTNVGTASTYTINSANQNVSITVRSDKRRYNITAIPYTNNVPGTNGSNVGGNIAGLFNNLLCGTDYSYTMAQTSSYVVSGVQLWDATNTTLITDYGSVGSITLPALDNNYTIRAFFNITPGTDFIEGPQPLIVATYPSCIVSNSSLAGCAESPQTASFRVSPTNGNQDTWFRFRVPDFSTGNVVITAVAPAMNLGLKLYTDAGVAIPGAEANATSSITAGERLIVTLTPGTFYRIAVKNMGTNSAAGFTICVNHLRPMGCSSVSAGSLCSTFSGAYTGANQYTYTFTNSSNPSEQFTKVISGGTGFASTTVAMSTVKGLRYGTTYNVQIDGQYLITDAAGATSTLNVTGANPTCTFTTVTQPATVLAAADRAPTARRLNSILSTGWVCGVVDYEWRVNFGSSVNRGFAERFIRANQLPTVTGPGLYTIDIRPLFSDGTPTGVTPGDWGTAYDLLIVAFANEEQQEAGDAFSIVEADRQDLGNGVTTALYPNPNNGEQVYVNLTGIKSDKVQIRVIDGMGRQVMNSQYSVNGSLSTMLEFNQQLTGGLYLVEYIFDGEVHTQRMVVTK